MHQAFPMNLCIFASCALIAACGDSGGGGTAPSCSQAAENICTVCDEFSMMSGFTRQECIEGTTNQCGSEGWSEATRRCAAAFSDSSQCGASICEGADSQDAGSGGTDAGGGGGGGPIPCGGETCDGTTRYCISSRIGDTEDVSTLCAPLPSGCGNCDCATNNAEDAWLADSGTNNCSGATLLCDASSNGIKVTCWKSSL